MPKRGFPLNWYWVADDGRVYSSALQKVVDKSDPGFNAALSIGQYPTAWPRQGGTGPQTDAALQEVISKYGLSLTPHDALTAYARAKAATISGGGTSINVMDVGQKPLLVEVDTSTRGLTVLHADFLHAQVDNGEVFHLQQSKGPSVQLTGEQIKIVHKAAAAFVRATSRSLSAVLIAIAEKNITTKAQVDNPPAGVTRWPANS